MSSEPVRVGHLIEALGSRSAERLLFAKLKQLDRRRFALWLIAAPVIGVMIAFLLIFGYPRFQHSVNPLIAILAGAGIVYLMLHRNEIRLPRDDHGEPNNKIPFDHPQIFFIRRPFTVALVGVCHSTSGAGAADYEDCPMDDG